MRSAPAQPPMFCAAAGNVATIGSATRRVVPAGQQVQARVEGEQDADEGAAGKRDPVGARIDRS